MLNERLVKELLEKQRRLEVELDLLVGDEPPTKPNWKFIGLLVVILVVLIFV
jgi:hypothetical protein